GRAPQKSPGPNNPVATATPSVVSRVVFTTPVATMNSCDAGAPSLYTSSPARKPTLRARRSTDSISSSDRPAKNETSLRIWRRIAGVQCSGSMTSMWIGVRRRSGNYIPGPGDRVTAHHGRSASPVDAPGESETEQPCGVGDHGQDAELMDQHAAGHVHLTRQHARQEQADRRDRHDDVLAEIQRRGPSQEEG